MGFGLIRVIHTSLNFGTRDVGFDCRRNVEGGEQTMGREWPDLGGLTLLTMTYGRANGKCIAAVVEHSGAESHGSLNQVAQKFW